MRRVKASGIINHVGSVKKCAYNVYDKRVDRCNSELSKVVLNQTMTIDSGSSLSQSEVHLEIFERTTESDAIMCANVINGRLLPLMGLHGFPVEGCRFQWNNATSYSPAEQREIERLILEYYNIPPEYFTEKRQSLRHYKPCRQRQKMQCRQIRTEAVSQVVSGHPHIMNPKQR